MVFSGPNFAFFGRNFSDKKKVFCQFFDSPKFGGPIAPPPVLPRLPFMIKYQSNDFHEMTGNIRGHFGCVVFTVQRAGTRASVADCGVTGCAVKECNRRFQTVVATR